jgi:hypothetical protein
MISKSIPHMDLHKPNNKLLNTFVETFLEHKQTMTYTNSQNLPRPRFGGNHHLPPNNIVYDWSWGMHPNVIFLRTPKLNFKKFKIGTPCTLEAHKFLCKPPIEVRSKAKL